MDAEEAPHSRSGTSGTSGAGREVEITRALELDECESHLIEMHSVYNVLNVAIFRIDAVGYLVGDAKTADLLMDQILEWHAGLADRERSLSELRRVPEVRGKLLSWMEARLESVAESGREELEEHIENIASIFEILETRVAELVRRTTSRKEWVVRFGVRGSNQGSLSHPGGGFGLTKPCHVAQSFGGRMWIRSSPGEGTTVTIRLPRPR